MKFESFKSAKERQEKVIQKFEDIKNSFQVGSFEYDLFGHEYLKLLSCSNYIISATCDRCNARHFVGFFRCKSRFCIVCNKVRQIKYLSKIFSVSSFQSNYYFHYVMTLRSYEDLNKMLDDISVFWRSFYHEDKDFRRWFKNRFIGGLRNIEIKIGKGSKKWHVHMHLLLITNKEFSRDYEILKNRWKKVTNNNGSVFIEKIEDVKGVIEALKYVTDFEKINLDDLQEIYLNVKGRRLLNTFGVLRGIEKEIESELDSSVDGDINFICRVCGCDRYRLENLLYSDIDVMYDLE